MASPVDILPVPQPRRAKRTKWCRACNMRIEAGTRYLEWNAWRWTHIQCPEATS